MCIGKLDLHPLRGGISVALNGAPANANLSGAIRAAESTISSVRKLMPSELSDQLAGPVNGLRRKLWDIPKVCHCPLIGVCFDREEVRQILARHVSVSGHDDYDLHVLAVSECASRNDISRAFARLLDSRFALVVKRYGEAANEDAIGRLWQADVAVGHAAGALWAVLSHPACSKGLTGRIYGDIHLLQHEAAAQARAGIRIEASEKRKLDELRCETARLKGRLQDTHHSSQQQIDRLRVENAALQVKVRALVARCEETERNSASLKQRVAAVTKMNNQSARALKGSQRTVMQLQMRIADFQVGQSGPLQPVSSASSNTERRVGPTASDKPGSERVAPAHGPQLEDRLVLCVGGRPGSIDSYRSVVQQYGGRFDHHDGGVEQKVSQLKASLERADVVVCLSSCVSHDAYWRVKKHCRRHGKQCVYMASSGVHTLIQSLTDAVGTIEPG